MQGPPGLGHFPVPFLPSPSKWRLVCGPGGLACSSPCSSHCLSPLVLNTQEGSPPSPLYSRPWQVGGDRGQGP